MRKILLLFLSFIMLISCEMISPQNNSTRNVYFISVALDYKQTSVRSLKNTLNDQNALFEELEYISNECGYIFSPIIFTQTDGKYIIKYSDYTVETVFNDKTPIKDDILNVVSTISKELKNNDILIFHYSGHGYTGTGELVVNSAKDFITKNDLVLITSDDLYNAMKGSSGIKWLIIDSCYSGVIHNDLTGETYESPFTEFFNFQEQKNDNIFVISGASEYEESFETNNELKEWQEKYSGYLPLGNMTRCVLRSLGYDDYGHSPGISSTKIYYSDIVQYVQKHIRDEINIITSHIIQHPLGNTRKDFLIYSR